MNMFDNYEIEQDVVDNTTTCSHSYKTLERVCTLPRKIYNVKNNLVGYAWKHGETFTLTMSVKDTIKVAEDAIIYAEQGQYPSLLTEGYKGQQAYNTYDCKSWTCMGDSNDVFFWVQDPIIIYPENGILEIDFIPDMEDKSLVAEIYNFRWEHIHTFSNLGSAEIDCEINKDISDKLIPGVYYCTLKITSESICLVKDKFMFIVE